MKHFTDRKLTRKDIVRHKDKDITNNKLNNLYIISRHDHLIELYETEKIYRSRYEYYGKNLTFNELVKISKIEKSVLWHRLKLCKWNVYEAVEIPVLKRKKRKGVMKK